MSSRSGSSVTTATRAFALVGALAVMGLLVWATAGHHGRFAVILAASLVPVGVLLLVGALVPGRDAELVLRAARVLASGDSKPESPSEVGRDTSGEPAVDDPWSNPSARHIAEVVLGTAMVIAILWSFLLPGAVWAIVSGVPLEPQVAASLVTPFLVRPLLELKRRV